VFSFILAEKANFPVKVMCETLGVSTSGFYAWRDRPPSTRARHDRVILDKIRCIRADSRETYGSPRVHFELRDDHDVMCGRKRVARLMRAHGIRGCCRRRRHWTTKKDRGVAPAADLLERDFTSPAPNRRWVADITQDELGATGARSVSVSSEVSAKAEELRRAVPCASTSAPIRKRLWLLPPMASAVVPPQPMTRGCARGSSCLAAA